LILFGDKIRSQTKPFLYLFQLVGAKDPVHELRLSKKTNNETCRLSKLNLNSWREVRQK